MDDTLSVLSKVGAAVADGEAQRHSAEGQRAMELLESACDVAVVEDNRTGEIVLLHRASGTLVMSDLLYKSAECFGIRVHALSQHFGVLKSLRFPNTPGNAYVKASSLRLWSHRSLI